MLISLDFTTLVANTIERLIGSDGSPYEKRADAKGRVLGDKCIADEVPFEELPEGWAWARLESALFNRDAERVPVSVADREKLDKIYDYYGASGVIDKVDSYLFDKPLLLVGEDGANLLTRSKPIAFMARGKYWVNNHAHVLDGISESYLEYIALYINSISLAPYVTGTAQPKMNQAKMGLIFVPLPPLAEQRRIVERVNELMPLVEEYGELEDAREALDAALPGRLRKSVLQLAVRGGLVPQDPADEPASALLERIRGQRRKLVAEKKMKAPKGGESIIFAGSDGRRYEKRADAKGRESEPVCIEDEIPFETPEGWEWARLGSLCDFGACRNIDYKDAAEGVWNLDLEDIEKDSGSIVRKKRKVKGESGSTKHVFASGSVLYSKLRPYLNKVVIADEGGVCSSEILPLNFLGFSNEYAQLVLMEPDFVKYAKGCSYGVKMPRLGIDDGKRWLVAVPPLAEQRRIVAVFRTYTANAL